MTHSIQVNARARCSISALLVLQHPFHVSIVHAMPLGIQDTRAESVYTRVDGARGEGAVPYAAPSGLDGRSSSECRMVARI